MCEEITKSFHLKSNFKLELVEEFEVQINHYVKIKF